MYMKSENSEIEVFICPDEVEDNPVTTKQEKSENSPLRPSISHLGMPFQCQKVYFSVKKFNFKIFQNFVQC